MTGQNDNSFTAFVLVFPFLVAVDTFSWIAYFHSLMASHALLMVGPDDPRSRGISLVKGLAVTGHTTGRCHTCRAVVVATLADRGFVVVKVRRQLSRVFALIHPLDDT